MSHLIGSWNVNLKAPLGVMNVVFEFRRVGSAIVGTMIARDKSWPVDDIDVQDTGDGERVRWTMTVREPMRATMKFDVTVRDDAMDGQGRANLLMRARVTGTRIHS